MNKFGIVVSVIAIFYLAGLLIYNILVPKGDVNDDVSNSSTTKLVETDLGYTKSDSGTYFKSYIIDKENVDGSNFYISNVNIKYIDNIIYVNDKVIIEEVQINRNFAIYSDLLLVIGFTYKDLLYSGFIMYNVFDDKYEIVKTINGRYIDDKYSFNDTGILLSTKLVDGKYFLLADGKKDICEYKLTHDVLATTSTMYIYDSNEKIFDDYEEISSVSLESYVVSNKLCEKST